MVKRNQVRRVAVYARLSVSREESVSIDRQIESARQLAAARGWEVVLVEADEGVSATRNRPDQRRGWRAVLSSETQYDAVIVWKVDRLARSVLDFMNADAALQARGAAVVAVEESVDMTTPQGRAFAQLLAVFAELEAANIGARVTAARRAILGQGRRAGGPVPFGYRNIPNPDGPGVVLAVDPDTGPILAELVNRALDGTPVNALARWLDQQHPPRRAARWAPATVEAILRNPVLEGQTPYTQGRRPGEKYTGDVYRDSTGRPIVDESLAIIGPAERRQLLGVLDAAKKPGTRAHRADLPPTLLAGRIVCSSCGHPLHRATAGGKYRYYRCGQPDCPAPLQVNRDRADDLIRDVIPDQFGDLPELRSETRSGNTEAARVEAALDAAWTALRERRTDRAALLDRIDRLETELETARAAGGPTGTVLVPTGRTLGEAWQAADSDAERNTILRRGGVTIELLPGRGFAPERFELIFPPPTVKGDVVRWALQGR